MFSNICNILAYFFLNRYFLNSKDCRILFQIFLPMGVNEIKHFGWHSIDNRLIAAAAAAALPSVSSEAGRIQMSHPGSS